MDKTVPLAMVVVGAIVVGTVLWWPHDSTRSHSGQAPSAANPSGEFSPVNLEAPVDEADTTRADDEPDAALPRPPMGDRRAQGPPPGPPATPRHSDSAPSTRVSPKDLPGTRTRHNEAKRLAPPAARSSSPTTTDPDAGRPEPEPNRKHIQTVMKSFAPVAKACYERLLVAFPGAEGTVQIEFDLIPKNGKGRIELAEAGEDTTLFDTRLHDCLLSRLGQLTFPKPGGPIHVNYPLRLTRGGDVDE